MSDAYRAGEYHGRCDRPRLGEDITGPIGTFYRHDYDEGYRAALNETWWRAVATFRSREQSGNWDCNRRIIA